MSMSPRPIRITNSHICTDNMLATIFNRGPEMSSLIACAADIEDSCEFTIDLLGNAYWCLNKIGYV